MAEVKHIKSKAEFEGYIKPGTVVIVDFTATWCKYLYLYKKAIYSFIFNNGNRILGLL